METKTPSTATYAALLASIKDRIQTAQVRAAVAVNPEFRVSAEKLFWLVWEICG